MKTPVIISEWKRIIEYPDNHLNDFCVFRDRKGVWHAIGIMGTGTWASEQSLFHSVSDTLTGKYENLPAILTEHFPGENASQKHAPYVVEKEGVYHMFYRKPQGSNYHLRTTDPFKWEGLGGLVFERNDARDACIIRHESHYVMYYCQWESVDGVDRSCVFLRESEDLENWGGEKLVFCDLSHTAGHAQTESPFIVERPEGFYMFARHRQMDERCSTVVLFSERHDHFEYKKENPWIQVFDHVHAPEIIESEGRFYLARVSGPPDCLSLHAPKKGGWVDIAEIEFR